MSRSIAALIDVVRSEAAVGLAQDRSTLRTFLDRELTGQQPPSRC